MKSAPRKIGTPPTQQIALLSGKICKNFKYIYKLLFCLTNLVLFELGECPLADIGMFDGMMFEPLPERR